ncbi:AraC family transcriptional regulator [Pseudoflavonifractor sp. 524-17]|uniref:helix-turn-helix transcriptional regulator n=1 Tax=Pseudoflavonifractor sp. 524-17 TaxID=2304577 RepID=UPI00137B7F85|nr:helix-turn-helix transcriptional regulator [Pseudoflavonifractor sp. 524-17]NCE65759.1 AraC family transcriptional regulator [Pseudoflavonifractor sp. 524-17]
MPPRQTEKREIRPAAPDTTVQGLLALPLAHVLPLSAGTRFSGYGKTGDYILSAAVQGNLTVSSHRQYALLHPGQAFLLGSPGEYLLQAVSDGLYLLVQLQGELIPRLLEERLSGGGALFSAGAAAVREAVLSLAVLEDEQGQAPGASASALAYALLLKLRLPAQAAEKIPGSPLVESALAIIQEEFPFLEGVDELAERLEVSPAHLSRVFGKKTGISPGKYITRVRIEYAKLLLQDPDTTIAYVAEASGFANANYFAKVFRRETGMSPSEYLESTPRQGGRIAHFGI